MNQPSRLLKSIALLAIIVASSIYGCSVIRELTYPQGFTYIEDKEVESLMQKMGESIGKLDQLVAEASPSDTDKQEMIIAELTKLETIATRLSGGHTQTNQFHISDRIGNFINNIGTAKTFAKLDPPRYDRIEYVTSDCSECHQRK
jgi:cytochrome c556